MDCLSCMGQRTKLEKLLMIVSGVASVLAVTFFAAFIASTLVRPSSEPSSEPAPKPLARISSNALESFSEDLPPSASVVGRQNLKICSSPACIHTASKLLKNMNNKVDPCDDFYDFACGSFLNTTRIPRDRPAVDTFSVITDQVEKQIRSLLDVTIEPTDPRPFVLAKTLFHACMNKKAIVVRGIRPLLDMLRRLGGWPVLDSTSWDEKSFTWIESVYRFRASGYSVDYFIDFSISVDDKNLTKRVIDLDQAWLGLNLEYLIQGFEDKLVQAYYDYMVHIAVQLGANISSALTELKESLQFEINLAKISLPIEKRKDEKSLYNPMTIAQLQQKYPKIPWLEYINRLLKPHVTVELDEVTIVRVPQYFEDLEILLENTPKRVQANYAMWRVAMASVSFLTDELQSRQFTFVNTIWGKSERAHRWQECADTTSNSLPIAVGSMYIKRYFKENSKANAVEMVNDIRQEFRKILTEVNWMDDITRQVALEKADAMFLHIAYPSEMLDIAKLTKFYTGLEMSPEKLLESVMNLTLFGTEYRFSKLREPFNKHDWIIHGFPAVVDALYSTSENSIQFPAGILQGALFSAARPAYMNYGAIGSIIGHEITHGFDDGGSHFDKNGNPVDWWQETTENNYLNKAKCIIDQYSNYSVKEVGLKLNGENTQEENIADNGGVKVAYKAYQAWTHRHGEEARLPGLEKYTPKQMFWLSAANTWCAVYHKEVMKWIVTDDFHAPNRFRVIGSLANMKEFADDFKCPTGSPMNPQNKCKVW